MDKKKVILFGKKNYKKYANQNIFYLITENYKLLLYLIFINLYYLLSVHDRVYIISCRQN